MRMVLGRAAGPLPNSGPGNGSRPHQSSRATPRGFCDQRAPCLVPAPPTGAAVLEEHARHLGRALLGARQPGQGLAAPARVSPR
ncbi:hypothetical protein ACFPM0_14995 [Pseudonocardia sulfidoxydans]|uniref:hypothetical protein n=1 Tax=Pseudonocardia sulfidoxydans TaxID=54011 RepID=UPI00361789B2